MFQQQRVAILMAAILCCVGCTNMQVRTPSASAQLAPTKGGQVAGKVVFLQRGDKVMIDARVTGLTPGLHGFHVHEKGDCSAPDASSAGAHFNPRKTDHGGTEGPERHAGDLGNLIADPSGLAVYKAELAGFTLGTGEDSIIGRALVVHGDPDDLLTQPAGNAGPRVACGLISLNPDQWFHSPQ